MSCLGNILWFCCCGIWLGLGWIVVGVLWCCTIIGIPIGIQCFKLARLSFSPFGRNIVYRGGGVSFLLNLLWLCFGGLEMAVVGAVIGLVLSILLSVFSGFFAPAVLPGTTAMHHGYNMYKAGLALGLLGLFL